MNSNLPTRQFDEIETTLRRDDPALATRFKKLQPPSPAAAER
jgi:hypothetical protein